MQVNLLLAPPLPVGTIPASRVVQFGSFALFRTSPRLRINEKVLVGLDCLMSYGSRDGLGLLLVAIPISKARMLSEIFYLLPPLNPSPVSPIGVHRLTPFRQRS